MDGTHYNINNLKAKLRFVFICLCVVDGTHYNINNRMPRFVDYYYVYGCRAFNATRFGACLLVRTRTWMDGGLSKIRAFFGFR